MRIFMLIDHSLCCYPWLVWALWTFAKSSDIFVVGEGRGSGWGRGSLWCSSGEGDGLQRLLVQSRLAAPFGNFQQW